MYGRRRPVRSSGIERDAEGSDESRGLFGAAAVEQAPHERAADDHAVGAAPRPRAAWSGVEMPTPSSTGLSVAALHRRPISPAWAASSVALAGHAHQRHAVDETVRTLADPREPVVGRRRRGEEHRLDARPRRPRRPSRRARRAGGRGRSRRRRRTRADAARSARGPCARRGCSRSSRRAARARRWSAIASITPIGVAPRSSARWLASWIVRPSMIGSENGMPTSTASAPASTTARTTSCHSRPSPPVTYGTSSLAPASRRLRRCVSRFTRARRASPRPAPRPCRRGPTA